MQLWEQGATFTTFPSVIYGDPSDSPVLLSACFLAQLGHPLIILFVNLQLIN